MSACSPQRFLANDRNLVRSATLTPSSVLPVADSVLEIPVARDGTGQIIIAGTYSGDEEATFDIEIIDTDIDVPLISAPVFTGAGSGLLSDISCSGAAQTFTLQLQNVGLPTLNAGIDFEGVRIVARVAGTAGNGITIDVDQTTLVFVAQDFSLLDDLKKGDGGENSGIQGAAFDWDTKVIGVDNLIPLDAHRVAFGDDRGDIYIQYKQYVDGNWIYHFVPELKRDIVKGTRISFVTGGRTVIVHDGVHVDETYTDVETVYDLLDDFLTQSAIVTVDGVIANDRTPSGQASKELAIRTDAHCEPSTGDGSDAAKGFVDTFANDNAATELVVATCYAVTSTDHPLARLGAERWTLNGSVSGDLGEIVTAIPYLEPSTPPKFGLTIPQRLPNGFGTPRGRFTIENISYMPRDGNVDPPPICPVALTLGTEAVDQTITLVWTRRPTGDCVCAGMAIPKLNARCLGLLGTEGGDVVGYSTDANMRLKDLYDWADSLAIALTRYVSGFAFDGVPEMKAQPAGTLGGGSGGTIASNTVTNQTTRSGPNTTQTRAYTENVTSFGDADFIVVDNAPVVTGYADVALPADFQTCLDFYENTLAEIDLVTDTTYKADGFAQWDAALQEFKDDLPASQLSTLNNRLASIATNKYRILLNKALVYANVSPLGKTDAGTVQSGDGCWRDMGGDYWTVTGSEKGAYAPLFNNTPYYSSVLAADGRAYFSSKEFGLQFNIKCPELLLYGDTVTLLISDSGFGATYVIGDTLTLPIIAAQDLLLAGGQDGNEDQTWYVNGTVDGSLPNFLYSPSSSPPGDYVSGAPANLSFTFTPGGIPNKTGDRFTFTVEGGHWRYRRNGGSWITASPPADVDDTAQTFVDGLTIQFQTGAYPSFVVGDTYSVLVAQPWAVSNLQIPNRYRWQWNEAAPTLVLDLGSAQAITMAGIARHTIPSGATLTLEGGIVAGIYTWTKPLDWTAEAIVKEFDAETARYLRLTLSAATGGGIGWFFAGEALATTRSADIQLRRVYKMDSDGTGLNQGGNYLGRAWSGGATWTEAALAQSDVDGILAMMDWAKMQGDEAIVVVPNITRPAEAYAVLLGVDDFDIKELSDYNRNVAFERKYSIELPLSGAWR